MDIEMLYDYIEAIILNILNKKDSYGYAIGKDIINKTKDKINIKNETIYLALKKMKKEKLIISYWIDSGLEVRRKQYSITTEGKKYLKTKKTEWKNNKNILDKLLGEK